MTALLALYFKLNVMLALGLLLWQVFRQLASLPGMRLGHARQLAFGRYLFMGMLAAMPVWLLCKAIVPQQLTGFTTALSGTWLAGELIVTAGLERGLNQQLAFGPLIFSLGGMLLTFLVTGFTAYLAWMVQQIGYLRRIIGGAVEWKSIRGVHLLFAPATTTPFSTRALGSKHVVLPWRLMESPRNLHLAVKHELQHLRNGDLDWVIFMEAIKALCFWNPAVWLWHNEFDVLQELACDEVLVNDRHVGSQAYGNCLIEVAAQSTGQSLPAASNMVPRFSLFGRQNSQLRRRIIMLAISPSTGYVNLKALGCGLFLGLALGSSSFWIFAAEPSSQPQAPAERRDYLPVKTVQPMYPARALEEKLEGWVQIQFTVDESGVVVDPVVVDNCVSEAGATCMSGDAFDAASLTAIRQFEFEPRSEAGVAVATPGVQYVFRFRLSDDDQ